MIDLKIYEQCQIFPMGLLGRGVVSIIFLKENYLKHVIINEWEEQRYSFYIDKNSKTKIGCP
jgi:hypothetical protein